MDIMLSPELGLVLTRGMRRTLVRRVALFGTVSSCTAEFSRTLGEVLRGAGQPSPLILNQRTLFFEYSAEEGNLLSGLRKGKARRGKPDLKERRIDQILVV